MSVFMLIEIGVKDGERYPEYMRQVPNVIRQYNDRYVVIES
jgi:uncharacterized protein (DUF1330 family)